MNWLKPIAKLYGTAALIGLAILGAQSERGQALLGRWSFVRYIANDHSTYYRLKVKLAYKGEEQDFDIVVGCNVHVIGYKDGGSTYEVGLIPTVFGRRMSDGKGLVVRPPSACRGETTANGRVQPDLLPIIVVYDDANTLDFGIAYLSEDAYESPVSLLKFGGATIEKATRADFLEFRRTQRNLVTHASYHSALSGTEVLKRMNIVPVSPPWAHSCEGYRRYLVPEQVRSAMRQYWPEGHPRYWVADTYDAERNIWAEIVRSPYPEKNLFRSDTEADAPRQFSALSYPHDDAADFGFPTRTGGGLVSSHRGGLFPPAFYPAASEYRLDLWPRSEDDWAAYVMAQDRLADTNIDYRGGQMKGFAYCYQRAFPKQGSAASREEMEKRLIARVDGENVISARRPGGPGGIPLLVFDRDQAVFFYFHITLESTRGDV